MLSMWKMKHPVLFIYSYIIFIILTLTLIITPCEETPCSTFDPYIRDVQIVRKSTNQIKT